MLLPSLNLHSNSYSHSCHGLFCSPFMGQSISYVTWLYLSSRRHLGIILMYTWGERGTNLCEQDEINKWYRQVFRELSKWVRVIYNNLQFVLLKNNSSEFTLGVLIVDL